MGVGRTVPQEWVLLAYRLPREPSTPRSAVWRRLKQLGVAQLVDGLVALPADARTREALEWVAEEVTDHGGEATVWLACPIEVSAREALVTRMNEDVAAEYARVLAETALVATGVDGGARMRAVRRLRRELRRIADRDHFANPDRRRAQAAVEELAQPATAAGRTTASLTS